MSEDTITVVHPEGVILTSQEAVAEMARIAEMAARNCYKSEGKSDGTQAGAEKFVSRIVRTYKHESISEYFVLAARVVCSRSCSHQIVRHRLSVYSQESQRYCDYGKLGYQIIVPPTVCHPAVSAGSWTRKKGPSGLVGWTRTRDGYKIGPVMDNSDSERLYAWLTDAWRAYDSYLQWMAGSGGLKPEDAREKLPNEAKTEVYMAKNVRQWRHEFAHRALNKRAQWQIREIYQLLLRQAYWLAPYLFDDLYGDLVNGNWRSH
jgi:thymidylate synthase (FAD)